MKKMVLFYLVACGSVAHAQQSLDYLDTIYFRALHNEQKAAGLYLQHLDFHTGLKGEVATMGEEPYSRLDELIRLAGGLTNEIIGDRKTIYFKKTELDSLFQIYQDDQVIYTLINADDPMTVALIPGKAERVEALFASYDSLCAVHRIKRISMPEYAATISRRLLQFQDSLMAQGRTVADLKKDLLARYPDKRSEEYRKAYPPLSELERMSKDYQQLLVQLENTLSRFDSANPEDYFYTGPGILLRTDVEATEALVMQLALAMGDFRGQQRIYQANIR